MFAETDHARRIAVLARAPVAGAAKSRLIPALGAEGAARLHGELLERTVRTVCDSGLAPVSLWCAPDATHPAFAALAASWPVTLRDQPGGDLGDRMHAALADALASADAVLLVGSDCPVLAAEDLAAGFAALQDGADAVLAPAEDGGYALVGVRRTDPELFAGIPWGGPEVMAVQRERLRRLGWRWSELRTVWDVDRPDDLGRLRKLGWKSGVMV